MARRLDQAGPRTVAFFKTLFLVAALYDGVLGVVFFFFHGPLFNVLDIALPNNISYIHLTAAFVFVQGVGYWFVYRNMVRNIDIVKMGVIYKATYTAVAVYYWIIGELLDTVFAWLAIFDIGFLALFLLFLAMVRPIRRPDSGQR